MKAIIIDDEPLARSIVKKFLLQYPEITIEAECQDGYEGVKAIQKFSPDFIFLDVQMPKINGFEMLELLEEPPTVIFTTAFDEYAMKAFEANAIDYLLKPFSQERFDKAMQKVLAQARQNKEETKTILEKRNMQPDENNRVVVKKGNDIVIIPIEQIHYFESYDDYVKIHTADGFYLKKKTMSFFEEALSAQSFVRIHRSFLLNIKEINKLEPMEKDNYVAVLRNNKKLQVSPAGYTKLRKVLGL
ncbi:MAG: LytTR family transcriptional regulator DNA-binding domain-containing protein [Cyclobacteriaceae bacterium]|jgi:two-component system LytT family response regulator|nr:LytTR family transcriptional regulator DNA-binding domain-containing protein [Cyclobacteriaceae bacterium]